MINWPTAWRPALRHGLGLVASGAVGEPVQLSHRGGHAGPREYGCSAQFCDWLYDPRRNGGGALVDYCGYGAILARAVLGRPQSVTAVAAHLRKEGLPSEDNAVVVLRYPRALAVLEGSWTQIGGEPGFAVIVYGDAGTLLVHQPRAVREGQAVGPGRVQLVRAREPDDRSAGAAAGRARRRHLLPLAPPGRPPDRRPLHAGRRPRRAGNSRGRPRLHRHRPHRVSRVRLARRAQRLHHALRGGRDPRHWRSDSA